VKVSYDSRTDTLRFVFRPETPVDESDETRQGIILDYDELGNIVSLEILDASTRVTEVDRVDFQRG
jgi:uncharacterized protein YuzE